VVIRERRVRAARHRRLPRDEGALARDVPDDLKNEERYGKYWSTIPTCTRPATSREGKDGYIMVIGRADDMIIVSGHNIGTAEVESALVSHHAVAEAAVIGKPDPMKGNTIKAFVTLRVGHDRARGSRTNSIYHVRMTLGPIAMPAEIEFTDALPKTRSGQDHAPGPEGPRARDGPRRPLDPRGVIPDPNIYNSFKCIL
jgi:acyl-coenzyme A synthetase/AMP-(fatty) acid ligase